MKQFWLVLILLVSTVVAFGQVKYEPGYFISSDGKRTECEIKNLDWRSNPTSFDYRVNGADGKGEIGAISEFGITGGSVFRRFTVDMDRSSNNTSNLTKDRNPEFKTETVFLRILINGKANLYMYEDQGLIRFFYSSDGSAVSQLVYKRYMQLSDRGFETGYAAENELYKQQLFNELKCASITQRDVEKLKYERGVLMKFFSRYNECTGSPVQTNEAETPPSPKHISLIAGAGFNSISYNTSSTTTDFKSAVALRFGFEFEAVLPFNKGVWSVWLQPVYQSYSTENDPGTIKVDYKSLDIGAGFRRYITNSDRSSFYANVGAVYALPIGGDGAIKYPVGSLDISASINVVAGVGFRLSKFTGELSYGFSRGVLGNYVNISSSYSGPIVMLGYRLK